MRPKCLPPSSCSPSRRLNARHLLVNRSVRLRVDAGGAAGGGDVLLSSGLLPSAPYALFAALCSLGMRWFSSFISVVVRHGYLILESRRPLLPAMDVAAFPEEQIPRRVRSLQ